MQESDLVAIITEAEQNLEELKKFSETPIPHTLAEAVEKGIDVALEVAEGALLIAYDPKHRLADRTRVIRLEVALNLLQEMENEYLAQTCAGVVRVIWGFFTSYYTFVRDAVLAIWAAIKALESEGVRQAILVLWKKVLREWLGVWGLAEVQQPLRHLIKLRQKYDVKARLKALPQRRVKRVWRRKRTRTA